MKKIIGFLSIMILFLVTSISEISAEQYMEKIGVEDSVIETLNSDQKKQLVENHKLEQDTYSSSQTQTFYFNGETNEVPETRATIPEKNFSMTVTFWNSKATDVKDFYVRVEIWYNWLNTPFNTLTDAIAVTWNDNFRYVPDSFFAADCGHNIDNNYNTINFFEESTSRLSQVADYGVTWMPNILTRLHPFGFGTFKLFVDQDGTIPKDLYLNINYAHAMLFGSVSFNLGPVGITLNGSNYDTAAMAAIHAVSIDNSYYGYHVATGYKNIYWAEVQKNLTAIITDAGYFSNSFLPVNIGKFFGYNLNIMKSRGYTTVTVNLKIDAKQINDGYVDVALFKNTVKNNSSMLREKRDTDLPSGNYTTYTIFSTDISFNDLDLNTNRFIIRFDAHGSLADNWSVSNVQVSLTFK